MAEPLVEKLPSLKEVELELARYMREAALLRRLRQAIRQKEDVDKAADRMRKLSRENKGTYILDSHS